MYGKYECIKQKKYSSYQFIIRIFVFYIYYHQIPNFQRNILSILIKLEIQFIKRTNYYLLVAVLKSFKLEPNSQQFCGLSLGKTNHFYIPCLYLISNIQNKYFTDGYRIWNSNIIISLFCVSDPLKFDLLSL
jgi:hypothetical protein